NLRKDTVAGLLGREGLSPPARAVLAARQAHARVTTDKLKAALAACWPDGRLRDLLVYHAAHTGRWAGRGAQPQNLPRAHPGVKDAEGLIAAAGGGLSAFRKALPEGVGLADGLAACCRPCFRAAPGKALLVADYASVEARGLAWLAGQGDQLEKF